MNRIDALRQQTSGRLPSKNFAPFLCPQPGVHLELLTKLAQVPVFSSSSSMKKNKVNVLNYKENRDYQHEYWLGNQDAHNAQDEQYSNPNVKDNPPFTVFLDFERFPLVELFHINAGEIRRSQVPGSNHHGRPPISSLSYHLLQNRVNSVSRREGQRFSLAAYDKFHLKGGTGALSKYPRRYRYVFGTVYSRKTKRGEREF